MHLRDLLFVQPHFIPPVDDLGFFREKRIGVTGHRGVLGRLLTERCKEAGIEVSQFLGDVLVSGLVDDWVAESSPDVVFHFAAVVAVGDVERNPIHAYNVNTVGTLNVVSAVARHCPTAWLFIASSSHVYAPAFRHPPAAITEDDELKPPTFYGVTKLAAELLSIPLMEHMSMSWCIGRIFSFSHRTQALPYLIPSLISRILDLPDGGELTLHSPRAVRDMLDAETVIDAILHLAMARHQGTINIGSGAGVTVEALALNVARHLDRNITIRSTGDNDTSSLIADVTKLQQVIRESK